jgi:hypothetical protein
MSRDLFLIAVGIVAVGLASWFAAGNPPRPTRFHAERHLADDPRLRFITERSEYMRSER